MMIIVMMMMMIRSNATVKNACRFHLVRYHNKHCMTTRKKRENSHKKSKLTDIDNGSRICETLVYN